MAQWTRYLAERRRDAARAAFDDDERADRVIWLALAVISGPALWLARQQPGLTWSDLGTIVAIPLACAGRVPFFRPLCRYLLAGFVAYGLLVLGAQKVSDQSLNLGLVITPGLASLWLGLLDARDNFRRHRADERLAAERHEAALAQQAAVLEELQRLRAAVEAQALARRRWWRR